jgi:hypothetical protein
VYALYPFTVPSEMRVIKSTLRHSNEFDYNPPQYTTAPRAITDPKLITSILDDFTSYSIPWSNKLKLLGEYGKVLEDNDPEALKQRKTLRQAVLGPLDSLKDFAHCLGLTTTILVRKNSLLVGNMSQLDIIKDVAVPSWTRFVARLFEIPMRGSQHPKARFDDKQLYKKMTAVYRFIYRNETAAESALGKAALQASEDLSNEINKVCDALDTSSFAHMLLRRDHMVGKDDLMPNHGDELVQRLLEGGKTAQQVASIAALLGVDLAIVGSSAVGFDLVAHATTNAVSSLKLSTSSSQNHISLHTGRRYSNLPIASRQVHP